MNVRCFDSPEQATAALAGRIADAIRDRPALVLGLPTGRTPISLYAELRRLHAAGALDFSRVSTFNLDEFVGLKASDAGSFRQYMERHLFRGVNLASERIHFLDGAATDPDSECAQYENALDAVGGIDLQVLGIGVNGHIGFNEPGDSLVSRTHRVMLADTTRRDNAAAFGGDAARVPAEALTIGMGAIMRASAVALVATGPEKASCIERMVRGPVTTRLPASFLQLRRHVEVYLDRAAARRL